MSMPLTDYERHILWLIARGLFDRPGNDRHPSLPSLRERGLVERERLVLTDKGREALEGKET